jgi:hypothetical protein
MKENPFSPTHITLRKRTKKGQKTERPDPLLLLSVLPSPPLYILRLDLQNKGESNSQPANTHSTDPTAPVCITYSQPPPSSGSAADAGISPTIFSYSCGPTQTTHIFLATATNAPASASSHTNTKFFHLPIYDYIGIGIGVLIVSMILWQIFRRKKVTNSHSYQCRHCRSTQLSYRTVNSGNPNGNVGRHYYVCVNTDCPEVKSPSPGQHERGWVAWDDDFGVTPGNPPCKCRQISRQDITGVKPNRPRQIFWTCKRGACDYTLWGGLWEGLK